MIYVYMHTCPNGKVYIGQTHNLEERWGEGSGYNTNHEFSKDIEKYGWNNIKHEILKECETRSEAIMYEMAFTIIKDSENPEHGYNKTHNKSDCYSMLASAKPYKKNIRENDRGYVKKNIFDNSGLTTQQAAQLIDDRVFSERDRKILKSKYIDDLSYKKLSEVYNISVRQAKQIVSDWQEEIKEYL